MGICVVDESVILLLVREDKRASDEKSTAKGPTPQLIAGAIAAFAVNNYTRSWVLHESPPQSKVMAGITMDGTSVVFYKIPVTSELVRALRVGAYSEHETVVFAHAPVVPRPKECDAKGTAPLDNKMTVLPCFEAFKRFVN